MLTLSSLFCMWKKKQKKQKNKKKTKKKNKKKTKKKNKKKTKNKQKKKTIMSHLFHTSCFFLEKKAKKEQKEQWGCLVSVVFAIHLRFVVFGFVLNNFTVEVFCFAVLLLLAIISLTVGLSRLFFLGSLDVLLCELMRGNGIAVAED